MPQVTCPNCGRTITLENRRKIDFDLIVSAVRREPKKFTDLLRVTKLSRKTLSLRLRDMCENGVLIKRDGKYDLNKAQESSGSSGRRGGGFLRLLNYRRIKVGAALFSLILLSSASGYGIATFLGNSQPTRIENGPAALGNLTFALDIRNVSDLYGWQAVITYNATELKVLEVTPGGFIDSQFSAKNTADVKTSMFLNGTISDEGTLLLGGCLLGQVPGVSGTGRLAIIAFAYQVETFTEPRLVPATKYYNTILLDSHVSYIPFDNSTLTLNLIEKH